MNEDVKQLVADILAALGPDRGDGARAAPAPAPARWRHPNGPVAGFVEMSGRLSATAHLYTSLAEVRSALRALFEEAAVNLAVRWDTPELSAVFGPPDQAKALWGRPVEVSEAGRARRLSLAARANAGIVWADGAIAETGSLFHLSGGVRHPSVSLLPPLLIALVDAAAVVPAMGDMLGGLPTWLGPGGQHQGLQFISGPSRSSDIENDLTIGVHGPGRVFILLLDGVSVEDAPD